MGWAIVHFLHPVPKQRATGAANRAKERGPRSGKRGLIRRIPIVRPEWRAPSACAADFFFALLSRSHALRKPLPQDVHRVEERTYSVVV